MDISTYSRAILLSRIANFLDSNPDYTKKDIDNFINSLDYSNILQNSASQISLVEEDRNYDYDPLVEKAKEVIIDKAVDIGVKWILNKLLR
ncbi:MAG: hypothetical protein K2H64_08875 [Desulfovibrio sp.]|nr:hypothetical protein [Desulfovibrio sp.]